mgnify:FL=1
MNILTEVKQRYAPILSQLSEDPAPLLDMIRPAGNPQHGDYQANFAMPLGKQVGKPPRDVAADIVAQVDLSDMCETPEVAGPGFINLKLKTEFLAEQIQQAFADERLGVPKVESPQTIVIDFSSPNVAKPMHVGHIRSTVIGDSLARTLRFLGHNVITDNHLGDWGTQFGMIIYGWKHFGDQAALQEHPVAELVRVYRQVRRLMDFHQAQQALPAMNDQAERLEKEVAAAQAAEPTGDKKADKKAADALRKLDRQRNTIKKNIKSLMKKIDEADADHNFTEIAAEHHNIEQDVLAETAKLHEGDKENLALWNRFLPDCKGEIQSIYDRLNVTFDHELGESFYHDSLADVVSDLEARNLARESDGATCVFLDGFETPMIIRKRDGAFLYATSDLATIAYRMKEWKPDSILYVVDHRQSEHFQKLFATAKLWNYPDVDLRHIGFGTVLGTDGKPLKTREGDLIGLDWLLDQAVAAAHEVVCELDDNKKDGPQLSDEQRQQVAWVIGHAAIKYTDLSQNRESDYKFDLKKMVSLDGDTATYMEYAYARVNSIFARGGIDVDQLRASTEPIQIDHEAERALALALLRFPDALLDVVADYRPNLLTTYLYELARVYSVFFEHCHVLKAESDQLRTSRLKLCDLTARILKQGLNLLGIDVVERM